MRTLIPSFIAALLLVPTLVRAETQPRTISTSGDAVVYVTPDEVILNVGVEMFNKSLDDAKAANDEACTRLLQALKALKIEERHIRTANLEVELRYRDHSHPSSGIEGYYARRSYSVTLKDVKLFEKAVDTALKNGANQLMGFDFRTTELRKHRDAARKMAINAAREKATALAGELGCKLGAPRTIQEGGGGYIGGWNWRGNYYNQMQNAAQVVGGGNEGGETLPLGQVGVSAQISVTFDLIAP